MKNMIEIGGPYIEKLESKARLCSDIKVGNVTRVMYFEVDEKWSEYLCTETIDAFVTGLLYYAVCNGYGIKSSSPMNGQLLFQMETYLLPVLNQIDPSEYKLIEFDVPTADILYDAKAVGTAVSGGVDSFYTIVKHKDDKRDNFKLTHLVVANLFNRYVDEGETRGQFERLKEKVVKIADETGLEMISIYTNHHEFMYNHFVSLYSFRLCSYIYALQKLFGIYYISSGAAIKDTNFYNVDSDDYDIFNLSMASTDTLKFYSSGGEALRTDKVRFISKDEAAKNHLHVCNFSESHNCSKCDKCMRTMLSLDIVGKLEQFERCFDLGLYRKNRNKMLSKIYSDCWHLYKDIVDSAKEYRYKIPLRCKFKGIIFIKPLLKIKNMIKKNRLIKRFYFKFKIDYLRFGKQKAELYRFGRNDFDNKGN